MLRKDEDGSIHIKKLNKNSIIIKDVTEPQNYCFSEEVIELNGKVPNTDFLRVKFMYCKSLSTDIIQLLSFNEANVWIVLLIRKDEVNIFFFGQ